MALLGPKSEDIRKIHAEINQLVNQRFLLTTAAITVFGVVMTWVVPRTAPLPGTEGGGFVFMASTVLSVILFALFLLSHFLKGMIRAFTTYLAVTEESHWEKDWRMFRQSPYVGYTKAHTLVFLVLNSVTVGFPFILARLYRLSVPELAWVTLLIIGGAGEVLLIAIGLFGWFDQERSVERRWKALKTAPD